MMRLYVARRTVVAYFVADETADAFDLESAAEEAIASEASNLDPRTQSYDLVTADSPEGGWGRSSPVYGSTEDLPLGEAIRRYVKSNP